MVEGPGAIVRRLHSQGGPTVEGTKVNRGAGRVRVVALVLGAALFGGVSAIAGTSLASIPDGSGVIHGCYEKNSGALRVIDTATSTCRSDEVATQWSQTGPQGVQGPPGVGTAGAKGLGATVVEAISPAVAIGAFGSATANCPAAEPYVLGGGGEWQTVERGGGGPYVEGSIPSLDGGFVFTGSESAAGGANGWNATGFNNGATGASDEISAWAVCAA
jgi:hypothetical protein